MEDNTSAKFEFLASFILPNGILDWFDFISSEMPRLNYAGRNASTGRHRSGVHRVADDIGRSIPESREL